MTEITINLYETWLNEIYEVLEIQFGMTRSDSQGAVDCQQFMIAQSWGRGLKPTEVVSKIIDNNCGY